MTFGIIANTQISRIRDVLPEFLDWIEKQGPKVLLCDDLQTLVNRPRERFLPPDRLAQESDMILSFGGDGTLLSTARRIGRHSTPILGVNLGGLGYLAEISLEDLYPRIRELLEGSFLIEERMVLTCRVEGSDRDYYALNDIVISKGAFPRVVHIRTTIDGRYLNTYVGDGLIIATPTGSTAYSLSSGGPIIEPGLRVIIVNPISPHTLADRPIVIGDDKEIEVRVAGREDEIILVADGQVECSLKYGDVVLVRRADYAVKLVLFGDKFFYDVLREKLKWGPPLNSDDVPS